jgi:hypothetical protein
MKFLIFLALSAATSARALTLDVIGEDGKTLFNRTVNLDSVTNVGQATVDVFNRFHVPYEGSAQGISKIFGIEGRVDVIVQGQEMKSYGWCFSIDGSVPETMSDETPVTDPNSKIEWFYAYAHFLNGEWVSQCERPTN